jgi:hypothetical protein
MSVMLALLLLGLILYVLPLPAKVCEIGRMTFFAALLGFCIRYHGELLHALR